MLELAIMLMSFVSFGTLWAFCAMLFDRTPMLSPEDV